MINLIQKYYKGYGFSVIRTRKNKPFGFVGYMLTIYSKEDDVTPIVDIKAKTLKELERLFVECIEAEICANGKPHNQP